MAPIDGRSGEFLDLICDRPLGSEQAARAALAPPQVHVVLELGSPLFCLSLFVRYTIVLLAADIDFAARPPSRLVLAG